MRHFIVLGFTSLSQNATGKQLHLGTDRAKAIQEVNKVGSKYLRRELYELAIPHIRRNHRVDPVVVEPEPPVNPDPAVDPEAAAGSTTNPDPAPDAELDNAADQAGAGTDE